MFFVGKFSKLMEMLAYEIQLLKKNTDASKGNNETQKDTGTNKGRK
jgi:hypothetical protein